MRKIWFELAIALAAALVAEGILAAADLLGDGARWLAVAAVFVVVLALAIVLGRRLDDEVRLPRRRVASGLTSDSTVSVKDLELRAGQGNLDVASDINSRGAITIEGVGIDRDDTHR